MAGTLYLEDGTIFKGKAAGASATAAGELVFNTSMVGYEKILTDPSYNGQIINMTYPLIGNYGISSQDWESDGIYAYGLVVRELCSRPSNYRSDIDADSWLREMGVPAVCGVDTRKITGILRKNGTMKCVITTEDISESKLREICVGTRLRGDYMKESGWAASSKNNLPWQEGLKVAVIDLGIKKSILADLAGRGCSLKIFGYGFTAEEILAAEPDGLFISNGPGDPKEAAEAIGEIKKLLNTPYKGKACIPTFGICMGHQLLALALGGDTYKLKYGHRGGNHGVYNIDTGKSSITSQNHGYAVAADSFPEGSDVVINEINLNDNTAEGMRHLKKPVFSVQYHPESNPGPRDSGGLFDKFTELMKGENNDSGK